MRESTTAERGRLNGTLGQNGLCDKMYNIHCYKYWKASSHIEDTGPCCPRVSSGPVLS